MSEITNTFITLEEMEAATNRLLETAAKVGADTWQQRVKNQTPHCKFGEEGICCRICTMGPCRITPKEGFRISGAESSFGDLLWGEDGSVSLVNVNGDTTLTLEIETLS